MQSTVCPKRWDEDMETHYQRRSRTVDVFFPLKIHATSGRILFPAGNFHFHFVESEEEKINILSAPETSVSNCLSGACSISCDTRFLPISLSPLGATFFFVEFSAPNTRLGGRKEGARVSERACDDRRMSIDSSGDLVASLSSLVPRQTDQ